MDTFPLFAFAVCEKRQADLVFLVDQSGSIDPKDYSIMKNFTIELVKSFKVSENTVRVGLAQFSSEFQDEFDLDKYYSTQAITTHILKMHQRRGGTLIAKALTSIKAYFEASRGGRRSAGVSQNLVLITDGESQDDVEDAAIELRALGIEVFAIGIGNVHDLELLQISGTPQKVFTVQNFDSLEKIKQKVVNTICKSKPIEDLSGELKSVALPHGLSSLLSHLFPPCSSVSMTNRDMCPFASGCSIDIAMGFDVSGAPGDTLISGHTGLKSFLHDITRYVSSIQGLCCVGPLPIKTNIGFRVVGRDGSTFEDYSFEPYSRDVVTKVMNYRLKEPTSFNTAMLKSLGDKLAKSNAGVKVSLRHSTQEPLSVILL